MAVVKKKSGKKSPVKSQKGAQEKPGKKAVPVIEKEPVRMKGMVDRPDLGELRVERWL
jgi:hypothetical protein